MMASTQPTKKTDDTHQDRLDHYGKNKCTDWQQRGRVQRGEFSGKKIVDSLARDLVTKHLVLTRMLH